MATTRFYHSVAVSEDGRLFEWGRNPQEMKMKMFLMRRLKNSSKKEGREDGEHNQVGGLFYRQPSLEQQTADGSAARRPRIQGGAPPAGWKSRRNVDGPLPLGGHN